MASGRQREVVPKEALRPATAVVGIAASAGGLTALRELVGALPAGFPAAIVIVQHVAPHHPSHIADILARHSSLSVTQAREGDVVKQGHVYVAAPDYHLVVSDGGKLSLTTSAVVHHLRPSADVLFESIANSFGRRCIAVVLTGTGEDGSAALAGVKAKGGTVMAQSEGSAEFFGMPSAAIRTGCVDYILPLGEMVSKLITVVTSEVGRDD